MVRELERESCAWTAGTAQMVRAAAENAGGNRVQTLAALRDAVEKNEAAGTYAYTEPSRYRLGQVLGGEEGRALQAKAALAMKAQGVHDPERWTAVWLPGVWGAAP